MKQIYMVLFTLVGIMYMSAQSIPTIRIHNTITQKKADSTSTTSSINTIPQLFSSENTFQEINSKVPIRLYPNPATGSTVTIAFSTRLMVEVFDILGKKVAAQKIRPNSDKLDISSLNSGMYLVKMTSNNSTETRKLIKR